MIRFASDKLVRVLVDQIILVFFKDVLRNADERIARVYDDSLIFMYHTSFKACSINHDLPAIVACCVDPDLFVALLKQLFIISAKTNLRWLLSRVVLISMYAEKLFLDHSLAEHLFKQISFR